MASIFDFLKRLFSRRPPPARPPAMSFGAAEALVEPPASEPPPGPPAPVQPRPVVDAEVEVVEGDGKAEEEPEEGEEPEEDEESEEEEEPDDLPAEEEFDDDDPLAPDPFVSPDAPAIEALSADAVSRRRAEAMALALTGEHRVFLAEAAGPGSLAEALNRLAQQGKVEAEFRDDAVEGPYLLYRVVPTPDG